LGLYLIALLTSLCGLVALDYKFKIAFFTDAFAAAVSIITGLGFFLVWDLFGIGNGIFFRGEAPGLTGLMVAPELPLEEIFFLILLCYTTLQVFLTLGRVAHRRREGKGRGR
jgi:lycopene cyclase domain-containing protein